MGHQNNRMHLLCYYIHLFVMLSSFHPGTGFPGFWQVQISRTTYKRKVSGRNDDICSCRRPYDRDCTHKVPTLLPMVDSPPSELSSLSWPPRPSSLRATVSVTGHSCCIYTFTGKTRFGSNNKRCPSESCEYQIYFSILVLYQKPYLLLMIRINYSCLYSNSFLCPPSLPA